MSHWAESYPLHRRDVAKTLLHAREDMLIITGLGSTNWDFTAAGDSPRTFPLWGAMGGAVSMGLGLALAQPDKRILVATGDGEMLMGIGSLATVAVQAPKNMSICVFDNERYGETGMQMTHTATVTDLALTAQGLGIKNAAVIKDESELKAELQAITHGDGPIFRVIKVRAEPLDFVLPSKDGVHLKNRFRAELLGPGAV
ncbi:MAG: thiamine pyrophosphate-dependent enzyme [Rhodospirillales bacterium]|jgi:thiamine pyrophosphate-dependent acetolactate synthase large subunit-like protein|nr:thiamine pyrophosphate-dependent enzyme [Rhodospirillales bacterium]